MYSATDEEILHDKARLICDQFLSSQILPKEYGFEFFRQTKFHVYDVGEVEPTQNVILPRGKFLKPRKSAE